MSWNAITSDTLKARMPVEWEAVKRVLNRSASDLDTVVAGIISDVTARIRGAIARGVQMGNQPALGAEGTLPPEVQRTALALIRLDLAATIPGSIQLNDESRKLILKDAENDLKALSTGTLIVSPADDAASDPPPSAPPLYGGDTIIEWPGTTQGGNF